MYRQIYKQLNFRINLATGLPISLRGRILRQTKIELDTDLDDVTGKSSLFN